MTLPYRYIMFVNIIYVGANKVLGCDRSCPEKGSPSYIPPYRLWIILQLFVYVPGITHAIVIMQLHKQTIYIYVISLLYAVIISLHYKMPALKTPGFSYLSSKYYTVKSLISQNRVSSKVVGSEKNLKCLPFCICINVHVYIVCEKKKSFYDLFNKRSERSLLSIRFKSAHKLAIENVNQIY